MSDDLLSDEEEHKDDAHRYGYSLREGRRTARRRDSLSSLGTSGGPDDGQFRALGSRHGNNNNNIGNNNKSHNNNDHIRSCHM